MTPGLEMPGLPEFPELNHWHARVDNIVGKDTELRTPFLEGVRITEPASCDQGREVPEHRAGLGQGQRSVHQP